MPHSAAQPVHSLLTTAEAAERLRLRRTTTVQRYVREGRLQAVKVGRAWLIRPESVDALLRG